MTQVIHLLVFFKVSTEYTLTHIQQTVLLNSTMLLDTKVHHHMTQDYSTAHTFHYRWFVLWERTPSSQKLDLRPDMVWLQTHSLKEQLKVLVELRRTQTATTRELRFLTSCKKKGYNSFCNNGDPTGSLFLCVGMQTINNVTGGKDNVTFQMGNTRSPRIRSRNS